MTSSCLRPAPLSHAGSKYRERTPGAGAPRRLLDALYQSSQQPVPITARIPPHLSNRTDPISRRIRARRLSGLTRPAKQSSAVVTPRRPAPRYVRCIDLQRRGLWNRSPLLPFSSSRRRRAYRAGTIGWKDTSLPRLIAQTAALNVEAAL